MPADPRALLLELRDEPDPDAARLQLGALAFASLGRFEHAALVYEQALRRAEDGARRSAIARSAARCWRQAARPGAAAAAWRRAVELDPTDVEAWMEWGGALELLEAPAGDDPDSLDCYARAAELAPARPEPHLTQARRYRRLDRPRRESDAYAGAEARVPLDPLQRSDWSDALFRAGRIEASVEQIERAIAEAPDQPSLEANRLVTLLNAPALSARELAEEHRAWGRRVRARLGDREPPPLRWSRGRPIRVGYWVNLRIGPVEPLLYPLFAHHDRSRVESFLYYQRATAGARAAEAGRLVDQARPIESFSGEEWEAAVRADGVDVLVDLCGHFGGCPADLHARRPAPLSVVLPGYPATTGLPADARLTDRWADPPGLTEGLHEETLVRLDRPFACYQPPAGSPGVAPPPCERNGAATFGLFHQRPKLNAPAARVWARILREAPGARLLIHNVYNATPSAPEEREDEVVQTLEAEGVDPGRIRLVGRLSTLDHLALFGEIDVALDSFPRSGMTTTLESLWMGVPVVSLAGEAHLGRAGVGFLAAVGLEDCVASDADGYVAKAVELAGDRSRLRALRGELRSRLERSPLMDYSGYAAAIEDVYHRLMEALAQGD